MATLTAKDKAANGNGWDMRHNSALHLGNGAANTTTHEGAIVNMLRGWENYAKAHAKRFESPIGEDYVLGPAWQQVGEGIRALLNGVTDRLDCGTVDGFILNTMAENGINTENL
jgi:hypothetical protein